jgi:hypothetical protein
MPFLRRCASLFCSRVRPGSRAPDRVRLGYLPSCHCAMNVCDPRNESRARFEKGDIGTSAHPATVPRDRGRQLGSWRFCEGIGQQALNAVPADLDPDAEQDEG